MGSDLSAPWLWVVGLVHPVTLLFSKIAGSLLMFIPQYMDTYGPMVYCSSHPHIFGKLVPKIPAGELPKKSTSASVTQLLAWPELQLFIGESVSQNMSNVRPTP